MLLHGVFDWVLMCVDLLEKHKVASAHSLTALAGMMTVGLVGLSFFVFALASKGLRHFDKIPLLKPTSLDEELEQGGDYLGTIGDKGSEHGQGKGSGDDDGHGDGKLNGTTKRRRKTKDNGVIIGGSIYTTTTTTTTTTTLSMDGQGDNDNEDPLGEQQRLIDR